MTRTTSWTVGVLALATLGVARAQEGPWPVEWRVDGTNAARRVEAGADGQVRLVVPAGRQEATVTGPAPAGSTLRLEGTVSRTPGVVGALEERQGGTPIAVALVVTRGQPAEDGTERAEAEVRVEGRVTARERWTAPGAPELEVVRVEGAGQAGLDPAFGEECRVRVRVRGRPQRVTLTVRLPEGARDERGKFYRDEGLDARRLAVVGPVLLEPGEHALRWDGRDQGPANRIALSGAWTLAVQSAEREALRREAVTAEVQVARPRYQPFLPTWPAKKPLTSAGLDRLGKDMMIRYRAQPMVTEVNVAGFLDKLSSAAVGAVLTHGWEGQFGLGESNGQKATVYPVNLRGKRLRDVHVLFVYSCRSGVPDGPHGDLMQAMVGAGVDVVVMSTETLLDTESISFYGSMGYRLLGYGLPLERAARDAAAFAHERVWERMSDEVRNGWLNDNLRVRPIKDALRVEVAPGIEKATEKLVPARHGNSRN
ncbi:MAG: hypothetical protein M9894_26820 [Planctomycetes bacterium]|nr:hypothetical protein [Planctomycetota bacterium]